MLYLHTLKIIAIIENLNKQYTVSQQSKIAKIFLLQEYYTCIPYFRLYISELVTNSHFVHQMAHRK